MHEGVTAAAVERALRRAVAVYAKPDVWRTIQRQGMRADVSWAQSGKRYAELYSGLLASPHFAIIPASAGMIGREGG